MLFSKSNNPIRSKSPFLLYLESKFPELIASLIDSIVMHLIPFDLSSPIMILSHNGDSLYSPNFWATLSFIASRLSLGLSESHCVSAFNVLRRFFETAF